MALRMKVVNQPMKSEGQLRANCRRPDVISSLYFEEDPAFHEILLDDRVKVETKAVGLNIRVSCYI